MGIKLHLGAFDCAVDGWVNTDITPHLTIARIPMAATILFGFGRMTRERFEQHRSGRFRKLRYVDLTKPLPFPDTSVSAVFSSHVFEHLFFDEVERLIVEIHRILEFNGICRVVVPDMDKIVQLYSSTNPRPFVEAMFEIGRRSDVKNSHHCGFTGASLTGMFLAAGFKRCEVMQFQKGNCPDIELLDNRPGSIFFEAVK